MLVSGHFSQQTEDSNLPGAGSLRGFPSYQIGTNPEAVSKNVGANRWGGKSWRRWLVEKAKVASKMRKQFISPRGRGPKVYPPTKKTVN